MKRFLVFVAVLAAAAACSGAATTSSGGGAARQPAPAQSGGTQPGQTGQPSTINGQPGGADANLGTQVPALQGPPVIRQAQLGVSVASGAFDSKLGQVRAIVESEGGFIAGTDAQTNPSTADTQIRTGVINFMVPAAKFDATIDELTKVGKVQSEHITGTDVSAQYVDLRARLANAQAQHDAMLALLAKAQNINDIIAVQNQIGQITGQIEQLKGQIKYLDDNTSFSAVTVTLTEAGAPAKAASSDSWGLLTAVNDAAHNFMTTINYAIVILGALGPFAILAGLGYLVCRRRRLLLPRRA